jgi:hypothetical protein
MGINNTMGSLESQSTQDFCLVQGFDALSGVL